MVRLDFSGGFMRSVIVTEDQHLLLLLALNDRLALVKQRTAVDHDSTDPEHVADVVQLDALKVLIRAVTRAGSA